MVQLSYIFYKYYLLNNKILTQLLIYIADSMDNHVKNDHFSFYISKIIIIYFELYHLNYLNSEEVDGIIKI